MDKPKSAWLSSSSCAPHGDSPMSQGAAFFSIFFSLFLDTQLLETLDYNGLSLPWFTTPTCQDKSEMLLPWRRSLLRPTCFPPQILLQNFLHHHRCYHCCCHIIITVTVIVIIVFDRG